MDRFTNKYRISKEIYLELKQKVLNGKFIEATKLLRTLSGLSLEDSRKAILSQFKLEYKLSTDMLIYNCIQNLEASEEINNLSISSDLSVILEYAKTQLTLGLNSTINDS